MMGTVDEFNSLALARGSDITYHRDDSVVPCPCLTEEGFRDPIWHVQHPTEPVCNPAGLLPQPGTTADVVFKGWCQPVQAGAVRRLTNEYLVEMFGEVKADDHIGLFPCEWAGVTLNFYNWGSATEDWVIYNGRKYTVVNTNLIAAPDTGHPFHHWEVGLRLISD